MDNIFERHGISANPLPFIFHLDRITDIDDYTYSNWHVNIELLYFVKGSGIAVCDDSKIEVTKGDIVIINSNIPHSFFSEGGMEYYCLIPDSNFCRLNGIESDTLKFTPLIRNDETAKGLFDNVVSEFTGTAPFREAGIRSSVLSLLLYITRNYTENQSAGLTASSEEGVRLAVSYICANFSNKISVDTLASISGFSKYYFLREFKRITGETPVIFINRIRCENAKRLLRSGALSIREVCEQCGFENLSYFSKTFKKHFGISPKQYTSTINKN